MRLKQARLWVTRSKNGLWVEHPIPGDELRAIKRYLATREDQLPWLCISERGQLRRVGRDELPYRRGRKKKGQTRARASAQVGALVVIISPTKASICVRCKIIWDTAIRDTRYFIRV